MARIMCVSWGMSFHFLAPQIMDFNLNGRVVSRNGNRSETAAPEGAYPCLGDDQWCAIAVGNEEQWKALRQAMGDPAWAREARFETAEAEAEVHSARLIMANGAREAVAKAERGEMPELRGRARVRRNQAYIAKLSVRAVDRLFEASGGHALFDASPMPRFSGRCVGIAELNQTTVRELGLSYGSGFPPNPQPTSAATPAIPASRARRPSSCRFRQETSAVATAGNCQRGRSGRI